MHSLTVSIHPVHPSVRPGLHSAKADTCAQSGPRHARPPPHPPAHAPPPTPRSSVARRSNTRRSATTRRASTRCRVSRASACAASRLPPRRPAATPRRCGHAALATAAVSARRPTRCGTHARARPRSARATRSCALCWSS
eukprot:259731-Chlamydomonas_euryale.AAC.1